MQTVHPRYTLAERLVLAVVTMITWPVEHFLGWARRKVAVDLVNAGHLVPEVVRHARRDVIADLR